MESSWILMLPVVLLQQGILVIVSGELLLIPIVMITLLDISIVVHLI